MRIHYEAFFILNKLSSSLKNDIEFKHITTEYKPAISHEHLYGIEAKFLITGYGNDDVNEGYKVKLISCESEELRELYNQIAVPHITLSIAENGKAVNTKNLLFMPIDEHVVTAKFGGFLNKPIFEEEVSHV